MAERAREVSSALLGLKGAVGGIEEIVSRLEAPVEAEPAPGDAGPETPGAAAAEPEAAQPEAPEPERESEPEPELEAAEPAPEFVDSFAERVELDAGPFDDFALLSGFEQALARLPQVEDVYVRRLVDDRAHIDLTLGRPGPLLSAMRASLPYELEVRSATSTALVVDVRARPAGGSE